jgi:hypothetical protein
MQIRAPIFVNGFQRGGTNILINLIASHPEVCWVGETHELFIGNEWAPPLNKLAHRALYLPVLVAARQNIFRTSLLEQRKQQSRFLNGYLDRLLSWKARVALNKEWRNGKSNNFVTQANAFRPLFKNVNGVVYNTKFFAELYKDATFIGLVRHGLALCEGFTRRGWTAERFGQMYAQVCQQMIEDAARIPNYHIIRFEDILTDPAIAIDKIYRWANLDIGLTTRFRVQAKKSMDRDGTRKYMFGSGKDREISWFTLGELSNVLRKDVNDNQLAQLKEEDKNLCLKYARETLQYFGYL